MSKELKKLSDFNISSDTKDKVIRLAGGVNRNLASHKDIGMEVGKEIADAHELLAGDGGEGAFSAWVDGYLKISRQTAYNYMWAYQKFSNCKTVLQFDAGAMYALASPKAPPQAAKEAEKLAEKGVRIDNGKAKELLDKFRTVAKRPRKKKVVTAAAESAGKPDVSSSEPTTSPLVTGPCPHGGEHDYDDEACKRCHDPKPGVTPTEDLPPAAKLFAKIDEHLGKIVRLLDDVNRVAPDEKLRRAIMDSLEVANEDIRKWKKGAKK